MQDAASASRVVEPGHLGSPIASATPIQHVVVIMEENHSFDNYFGTFPAANGIQSGVCVPDPATSGCDAPYHNVSGLTHDLPHNIGGARTDIDKGKMDGFVRSEQAICSCSTHYSMGYLTAEDVPIFWRYAENYTLSDRLFEPVRSWSYPSHLMMVSDWSAKCTSTADPMSCTANASPNNALNAGTWPANQIPWTDLTWLLHGSGVSWGYYVAPGTEPDCTANGCTAAQNAGTPSMWNPLPWFSDVQQDGQLGNVKEVDAFYSDLSSGGLPAVSWIVPNRKESGHPGVSTNADSESYVVSLINAIESSSAWNSTAILLAWDDWGGQYDHVVPPTVDSLGFGLRVPSILISPYSKKGYVDDQTLTFDAYNKFVEDNFLGGHRLDPATDGRPDSRQTVRESDTILGDLTNDFDFTQPPSAPILLPTLSLPSTITRGGAVTATGAHFKPGDTVSIVLNCGAPDCASGVSGATVTAAADGTISASFTMPSTLPVGGEYVSAEGSDPLTYFAISSATVN